MFCSITTSLTLLAATQIVAANYFADICPGMACTAEDNWQDVDMSDITTRSDCGRRLNNHLPRQNGSMSVISFNPSVRQGDELVRMEPQGACRVFGDLNIRGYGDCVLTSFLQRCVGERFLAYRRDVDGKSTVPAVGAYCVPVVEESLGECDHNARQFYNVDGVCKTAGDTGSEETEDQRCKRDNPQTSINEYKTACVCTADAYLEPIQNDVTNRCRCKAEAPYNSDQKKCVKP